MQPRCGDIPTPFSHLRACFGFQAIVMPSLAAAMCRDAHEGASSSNLADSRSTALSRIITTFLTTRWPVLLGAMILGVWSDARGVLTRRVSRINGLWLRDALLCQISTSTGSIIHADGRVEHRRGGTHRLQPPQANYRDSAPGHRCICGSRTCHPVLEATSGLLCARSSVSTFSCWSYSRVSLAGSQLQRWYGLTGASWRPR